MNWKMTIWAFALAGCSASRGQDVAGGENPVKTVQMNLRQTVRSAASINDDVRFRYTYDGVDKHTFRLERPSEAGLCLIWEWSDRSTTGDKQLKDLFPTPQLYRDSKGWNDAGPFKIQWDQTTALVDVPRQGGTHGPCKINEFHRELTIDASEIEEAKADLLKQPSARYSSGYEATPFSNACASADLGSRTLDVGDGGQSLLVNHVEHRIQMLRVPTRVGDLMDFAKPSVHGPLHYDTETGSVHVAVSAADVPPSVRSRSLRSVDERRFRSNRRSFPGR